MGVFKSKEFAKFARKERISDEALCESIKRAERGLIDADLGSGLIKQRVARPGQGRSGGYRTIMAFRSHERSVFLYAFAKSGKANLSDDELAVYRRLSRILLSASAAEIETMLVEREVIEVVCDD